MKTTGSLTLFLALVGMLAGCGSEGAPRPKTTPAGGDAGSAAEAAGDTAGIASREGNRPPVIRRVGLRPSRPLPGIVLAADVDAVDPDGDPISLSYTWTVDGARVGEDAPTLRVPDVSKSSVIQLAVIARDRESRSEAETVTARVGNRPPTVLGVVIEPLGEVRADRDIAARPQARDPDGDALEFRYQWRVNGEEVDGDGEVLPASHYARGDQIELSVVAYDGDEASEPLRSAPFPVVNSPPRITSIPGGFDPDGTFRYAIRAEDPDGDRRFRYRLAAGPDGMAIDMVSGALTWVPMPDQAGSHPVAIEVSDRNGGVATQGFDLRVEFEEEAAPAAAAP